MTTASTDPWETINANLIAAIKKTRFTFLGYKSATAKSLSTGSPIFRHGENEYNPPYEFEDTVYGNALFLGHYRIIENHKYTSSDVGYQQPYYIDIYEEDIGIKIDYAYNFMVAITCFFDRRLTHFIDTSKIKDNVNNDIWYNMDYTHYGYSEYIKPIFLEVRSDTNGKKFIRVYSNLAREVGLFGERSSNAVVMKDIPISFNLYYIGNAEPIN